MEIIAYSDASCHNTGNKSDAMGVGVVVYLNDLKIYTLSKFVGFGTTNIGEFIGMVEAVKAVADIIKSNSDYNITNIEFKSDSKIVVETLNGNYRNRYFQKYENQIKSCLWSNGFNKISCFKWVPREQNTEADSLSHIRPLITQEEFKKLLEL